MDLSVRVLPAILTVSRWLSGTVSSLHGVQPKQTRDSGPIDSVRAVGQREEGRRLRCCATTQRALVRMSIPLSSQPPLQLLKVSAREQPVQCELDRCAPGRARTLHKAGTYVRQPSLFSHPVHLAPPRRTTASAGVRVEQTMFADAPI